MSAINEIFENGIVISIDNTVQSPKKNEIIFNADMVINRSLVLTTLGSYIESNWCLNKTVRCLDGFAATGISGLSWIKTYPEIEVTLNDPLENATKFIKKNAVRNNLDVEVTQYDINVLLLQRTFDFIYLDCYGSSVHYLDALFKNAPKNSVLVITSMDDAALYGKAPDVTLRNYGGYILKTFYSKELAARLVIAGIVRAAAKYNKAIEVLSSIAVKSHITVIVKVTRGPATQCVHKIQKVIHCCLCEDRAFYPQSIYPIENPYACLSCKCRSRSSGHVAVELGPVWVDAIFNPEFCSQMLKVSSKLGHCVKISTLLKTILAESLGGTSTDEFKNYSSSSERSENEEEDREDFPSKKIKLDYSALCSPFYFNLHRHSPKGYDLGKLNKVVSFIQASGHRASRTHFDPESVRTSASLQDFTQLLMTFLEETKH